MNVDTQTPDNTQGGAAAPAASDTANTNQAPVQVPRSDAEAEAMERDAAASAQGDGGSKEKGPDADPAPKTPEDKQKGHAAAYIKKLQDEARELRRKTAEQEYELQRHKAGQGGNAAAAKTIPEGFTQTEPQIEDYDFDPAEYGRAWGRWDAAREAAEKKAFDTQYESKEKVQETLDAYEQRIADFAAEHADFQEVVNSIEVPLPEAVQLAIMRHENAAEIAYHLGKNEDDAFALASVNPALAEKAVERLASRMTAAQSKAPSADESGTQAPQVPDVPGFKPTSKSVSKAPAPAPTLSGKSPGEVPAEKMTDGDWYEREAERERKR